MEFINNILPGNYWLTKSMEFVKINSSGTLWYLKKWIVYYHYIFFKDSLYRRDYQEISRIFNDFIESLDSSVHEDAKKFFFEVDINSADFIKINDFIRTNEHFESDTEHRNFILNAKKFYFIYVMNIGGQAKFKKRTKEIIRQGFTYEETLETVKKEMLAEGKTLRQFKSDIITDYHATIRNERQIFFYYGFFHGKESSDLTGFYNLTNIGKTIIKANFHELLVIWEHQKIKMISQSPVADIQKIEKKSRTDYSKFSILNHPYYTLLEILNKKNVITSFQYQYVISKINNETNIDNILNNILENTRRESLCMRKALSFNRMSEKNSEDFLKELKKFILGICELPKDENTNHFVFTSWVKNNNVVITKQEKANYVLKNYKILVDYLENKYKNIYKIFQSELKEKYLKIVNNEDFEINDDIKYEWYKYIINYDRNLYINLIYISIALKERNFDYSITVNTLYEYYDIYKFILTSFGIKKKEFKNIIIDIQLKLHENQFYVMKEDGEYVSLEPEIFIEEIAENNLRELSLRCVEENNINTSLSRKRNFTLISLIRSYYINNYSDNVSKLIKCDCCESNTFIKDDKYPYLEFHHLIPFSSDFGPDHYLNLFGICPNCHRKLHYINKEEKPYLYINLSNKNNIQKNLFERIDGLIRDKALEPIHIDFLKKEKIINNEQYDNLLNNFRITGEH